VGARTGAGNDIEYLRLGLIRVDAVDRVLVELRESMR
jgi:hypothetical protein